VNKVNSIEQTRLLNNKKYREWYKKEILPKNYSPIVHLGVNIGLLLSAILVHFVMVKDWSFLSLVLMIMIFFLGNVVVFILHKYPLHRRYKWWTFPYDTHTVEHHRYFTAETITFDSSMDFNAVFFPMSVVAGFTFIGQPLIYFAVSYYLGADVGHVLAGSAAGYFLMYEFFHWASHLAKDHFLMNVPWILYMRQHHLAHHNPRLMSRYNFGIVDPIVDFIMGTKYQGDLPQDLDEDHYKDVKSNLG